jgi:hypothetical protein
MVIGGSMIVDEGTIMMTRGMSTNLTGWMILVIASSEESVGKSGR